MNHSSDIPVHMRLFQKLLLEAVARRFFTVSAFAKAAGEPKSSMGAITNAKYMPRLARVDQWAKTLSLSEEERVAFMEAALLAHCPLEIEQGYLEMKLRLKASGE